MIAEGCLEGVDEVYGLHNIPDFTEGDIRSAVGPVMANSLRVEVIVKGQGGHGSTPHKLHDPITASAFLLNGFHAI